MRYKPKTRPRPYQARALKRAFACNGRYGLFLEPGTGKTKIAIDFCAALYQQGRARIVLVVMTAYPVWQAQLSIHCPIPYHCVTLTGSTRLKALQLASAFPRDRLIFILLNYESTWRLEEALLALEPDVLILDEAHKIKTRTAKQSKCLHRLTHALDPFRLLLTGTPISNSPLDLFSEFLVIDDSIFGRSYPQFSRRYADFYGQYHERVVYKNLSDLRRRALTRATVLTKEECLDLPDKVFEEVPVVLSSRTRKAYDEMALQFITFLDTHTTASAAITLTQMLRLSQITGGFVTSDETHLPTPIGQEKLLALEGLLDTLTEAGEKVVVFARFRPEIEAIDELCKKKGIASWKYYGPVKGERLGYPVAFTSFNGPGVFIAQTATGALSIDLSAAAYGVFYSFDYSLINWTQCHDRIHRFGQKRKVTYYYLVAQQSIDEIILHQALQEKKRLSSLLGSLKVTMQEMQEDAVKMALSIFGT